MNAYLIKTGDSYFSLAMRLLQSVNAATGTSAATPYNIAEELALALLQYNHSVNTADFLAVDNIDMQLPIGENLMFPDQISMTTMGTLSMQYMFDQMTGTIASYIIQAGDTYASLSDLILSRAGIPSIANGENIAVMLQNYLKNYNYLHNANKYATFGANDQLPIGEPLLAEDAAQVSVYTIHINDLLREPDQSAILPDELQTNIIDVVPQQVTDTLVTVGDTAANIVDTIYTATAADQQDNMATAADQQDNMATAADQQDTAPAPSTDAEKAARTKKVLLGASVALFLFKLLH